MFVACIIYIRFDCYIFVIIVGILLNYLNNIFTIDGHHRFKKCLVMANGNSFVVSAILYDIKSAWHKDSNYLYSSTTVLFWYSSHKCG